MNVKYDSKKTPEDYCCEDCHVTGIKLWRESYTFSPELRCATHAALSQRTDIFDMGEDGKYSSDLGVTDQIGWYVPAVPDEEGFGFWGYTSVPEEGVNWWRNLPTFSFYLSEEKQRMMQFFAEHLSAQLGSGYTVGKADARGIRITRSLTLKEARNVDLQEPPLPTVILHDQGKYQEVVKVDPTVLSNLKPTSSGEIIVHTGFYLDFPTRELRYFYCGDLYAVKLTADGNYLTIVKR